MAAPERFAGTREAVQNLRETAKGTWQQWGTRLGNGSAKVTGLFDGAGTRLTNAAGGIVRFAGNHPVKLLLAGAVGAYFATRSSRREREAQDAQLMGYAPMGGAYMPSYKGTTSPEDFALMQARLRDGGAGGAGFAANVTAQREAAAQQGPQA